MELFITVAVATATIMLIWDCVEVGRNDAANLINAVFGARVLRRKTAVWLAGLAVLLGASFSSPVMETARKGIFDPGLFTIQAAMTVYISVYIVDTVLLYAYSAFGMPVSTTASLVFELVGAALGVSIGLSEVGMSVVHWAIVGKVVSAIILSILLSGIGGFLIQRVFRGVIRDNSQDREAVLLHGPWVAGLIFTFLFWFMLMKGLKAVSFIQALRSDIFDAYGVPMTLLVIWGIFTLVVHLALILSGQKGPRYLFHVTTLTGMLCVSFAFGQNDLANCASPGLSTIWLWNHADQGTAMASQIPIPKWALFSCGLFIVLGMQTRNAQRVTRAAVNTGSQFDQVALWAPQWCIKIAGMLIRPFVNRSEIKSDLAPSSEISDRGKKVHFDTLRASVIMAVSACVIAFASGRGLPVSTTYVAFAAVVATGWADRVFIHGDAKLKYGRAIWVVTSWFLAALIAMVGSAIVARVVFELEILGLILGIAANLGIRFYVDRRSLQHEKRFHKAFEKKQTD